MKSIEPIYLGQEVMVSNLGPDFKKEYYGIVTSQMKCGSIIVLLRASSYVVPKLSIKCRLINLHGFYKRNK